jgi:DNA-binding GntR family transcriptional regulator
MYNVPFLEMKATRRRPGKTAHEIPATRRVEAHLRTAIHTGKLRPRQRIIEEELARELNLSRGPVREALLRLERDSLVVTTARRGTFVRDISLNEIGVVFRMRAKLEGLCVRYMRENTSVRSAKLLNEALKKLNKAAAKNSNEQFVQVDMELHRTIWKAAHQPLLYRALNSIMNPYIFIIASTYSSRIPLASRRESHENYVRLVLETPVSRVEREVERYFEKLHASMFPDAPPFSSMGSEHWPDLVGHRF